MQQRLPTQTLLSETAEASLIPQDGVPDCAVTNTGKAPGQEVVQVYVEEPRTLPFVPYWKRMLGFGRTPTLAPGDKATITISLLWCVTPSIRADNIFRRHRVVAQFTAHVLNLPMRAHVGLTSRCLMTR